MSQLEEAIAVAAKECGVLEGQYRDGILVGGGAGEYERGVVHGFQRAIRMLKAEANRFPPPIATEASRGEAKA